MIEMLFSALFGGATGLIGTLVGKVFGWLELREKRKTLVLEQAHELALFDRQAELRQTELESERVLAETEAWRSARVASYSHDGAAGESYRWVAAVLRLVRPALTLTLLLLTGWVVMRVTDLGLRAEVSSQIVYLAAMAVAWWFGDRAPVRR
ncbi:hypothetical protein ACFOGJ_28680 [Marinibaculum pumilum]|uniref:Uncharacterized protein n=1 Tax=Marinibaculum pumilum TaxID=1766165 RepID=A0ABV7L999_9PROT